MRTLNAKGGIVSIYLLMLFIPPILVVLLTKMYCGNTITLGEVIVQFTAPLVLVAIVWNVSMYSILADTEILSGQVTDKSSVQVSCSHSYDCHCKTVTSGSGKNRTTRTKCDTCHEHAHDWNWVVTTSVGDFTVDRIDRQGYNEPPRWSSVYKGQPAAREHDYVNYVRAAPDSLLHISRAVAYRGPIPNYPEVFDYQHVNHVQASGMNVPNLAQWNEQIALALRTLGPKRQVNINLVFTGSNPAFSDALRKAWMGGKKNDVTIVVGTNYPKIRWVRVFSWSKYDLVNVALRSDLLDSKFLDPQITTAVIAGDIDKYYRRRPMADFEYLRRQISPPLWVMILAFVLSTALSVWLGYLFHHNDFFPSQTSKYPRRRVGRF